MSSTPKSCRLIGAENSPIPNVLLTFSTTDVVNSKFPCVKPPPLTVCNPTISSENVPAPDAGLGGKKYLVFLIVTAINLICC